MSGDEPVLSLTDKKYLRDAAAKWDELNQEAAKAAGMYHRLSLTGLEMGLCAPLAGHYNKYLDFVLARMSEASVQFAEVRDFLLASAGGYARQEEETADSINQSGAHIVGFN